MFDRLWLLLAPRFRVACVRDVQQEVGFADLFQSGAEGCYELRGQLLDESNGVAEQRPLAIGQRDLPRGGIEGGK